LNSRATDVINGYSSVMPLFGPSGGCAVLKKSAAAAGPVVNNPPGMKKAAGN
jgi:hypothetical protein